MIVTVASRHMDVTPALKAFAEQKANKLLKYYDRIQEIELAADGKKCRFPLARVEGAVVDRPDDIRETLGRGRHSGHSIEPP